MRDLKREASAARTLHAWLRRAALSAIPFAGIAGCGSNCDLPDYATTVQVDGGVPWATGSQQSPTACAPYCGTGTNDVCYRLEVTGCVASTQSSVSCQMHYSSCSPRPCGRVPAGLKFQTPSQQPSLAAAWLAEAARLEGAAVLAFQALERELIAHAAPVDLVSRVRSAQRDEARHHAATTKLAARFGARVPAVEIDAVQVRPLLEVAVENALEGCVRETYGAAVAVYQGEWAQDPAVRRTMRSIAFDEAEHASLGWAVDGWSRTRLGSSEIAQLDGARRVALERLHRQALELVPVELSRVLGIPDPQASRHLLQALAPLWS